jgi:glutamate-1-semialdehyde 2,1-aminomutase
MLERSQLLFDQAKHCIPGGVNSPVRAFNGVGGHPIFMARAEGAYIYDEDGNRYIDYVGSWGPMIVGHAHPDVTSAIESQLKRGVSFGTPTALETALAEAVCALLPSVEKIRMVSSGTEAAMSAIRLARGITGRSHILKFEGCYHGHADSLLVKAGSGALTLGIPTSPGVPTALANLTLTASYNDREGLAAIFKEFGHQLAAVIIEPIAGNMNCVLPMPGFLEDLRKLTAESGTLLIFDEVMTGFRVHRNSAQGLYGIVPDLTILGKVIGGGLPVGAFGGPAKFMDSIAPSGPIYQAGTLSGNPLAMASGLATLKVTGEENFYTNLTRQTRALTTGLQSAADKVGIPFCTNTATGMFGLFFTKEKAISRYAQVMACELTQFKRFYHAMLARGVYLAPSAFEAGFLSSAHSAQDIAFTIDAACEAFQVAKSS